jgi:predicted TIM-barrel fold metal-dependent hydrolase
MALLTDLHQHVWTRSLLDALAARDQLPFVRRHDGVCILHCAGETPWAIDERTQTRGAREALLDADRADRAVVALSSPIGIETLPGEPARELIAAHLDGVAALGPRFSAWGPVPVRDPDPRDVDAALERGCVGISVPATAVATRPALYALGPVLERVSELGVPLLVHPGAPAHEAALNDPLWWTALTDYVNQMQVAWLTLQGYGRREHPRLRIVHAMLAGAAPTLAERLSARGGPAIDLHDPLTFYDTSSYGPMVVEAMARWLGPDRLVYGSDRPVIDPVPTGRETELMTNATALIASAGVLA